MEEEYIVDSIPALALASLQLINRLSNENEEEIDEEALIQEHLEKFSKDLLIESQNALLTYSQEDGDWLNVSEPLSFGKDLEKTIVVMDFFTYCCINCLHILPDLEALEEKYRPNESPVLVIGVHSAKFENEKLASSVRDAISRHHISHPIINDVGCKLWHSLGISAWPTILILGPSCKPLFVLMGEGHREVMIKLVKYSINFFESKLQVRKFPLQPSGYVPAVSSGLSFPGKVICNESGLIIADSGNNRIILADFEGNVKEIVGSGRRASQDGSFSEVGFNNPQGLAVAGNFIYVADTDNHLIRMINLESKQVTTLAGNGVQSNNKEGGLLWTNQGLSSPWDVCLAHSLDRSVDDDEPNLLLIAMAGIHQIWAIFLHEGAWLKKTEYEAGTVMRLAGSGVEENRNTSYPMKAGFAQPSGICLVQHDHKQAVLIADSESSSVRQFTLEDGVVKRVVGGATDPTDLFSYGDKDGSTKEALLQHPMGVAACAGNVYVADTFNHKIKRITRQEKLFSVETFIGANEPENMKLNEPGGMCVHEATNHIFIADTNNHKIKRWSVDEKLCDVPLIFEKISSNTVDVVDSPASTIVVEVAQSIQEMQLKISLALQPEISLNSQSQSVIDITQSDGLQMTELCHKICDATVNLPLKFTKKMEEVQLSLQLKLFLCSTEGFCSRKTLNKTLIFREATNPLQDADITIEV